jgi:hypothetical protein
MMQKRKLLKIASFPRLAVLCLSGIVMTAAEVKGDTTWDPRSRLRGEEMGGPGLGQFAVPMGSGEELRQELNKPTPNPDTGTITSDQGWEHISKGGSFWTLPPIEDSPKTNEKGGEKATVQDLEQAYHGASEATRAKIDASGGTAEEWVEHYNKDPEVREEVNRVLGGE